MSRTQPLVDIAASVGVSAKTLAKHAKAPDFPAPRTVCGTCGTGLLFEATEVQRYESGERVPRPRKKPVTGFPLAAIAEQLDMSLNTLRHHSLGADFPAPLALCGTCKRALVYDLEAVRRFEDGTPVDPSETLVTLQEAAEHLGLGYASMRTYLGRHENFPKPLKHDGARPLFSLSQIQAWQDRRQRTRAVADKALSRDVDEVNGLLTRAGVARELGIEPDSVTRYARRDTDFSRDFPQPVQKLQRARLWDPEEIRAWRDSRPRAQRQP